MYIVSVIPVMKRAPQEDLSYYSAKEIPVGSIVRVPVGKRNVHGLVVDVANVKQEKTQIKKAKFSLKKIDGIVQRKPFDPPLLQAIHVLAAQYACTVGTIVHAVVPEALLSESLSPGQPIAQRKTDVVPDVKIAAASYEDRVGRYKSLTRESFAREQSVVFICPTQSETDALAEHIGKGIEDRLFVFHSRLTPKKIKENWKKALAAPHPVVIVGTGICVTIPRHDIGLYVVEHESSPHFKQKETPYIDTRVVAEHIARARGCDLILGDAYPRIETLHRYFTHAISDIARPTMRQEYRAAVSIVDMRAQKRDHDTPLSIFSDVALNAITEARAQKRRTVLFCVRKGFAPFTVCRDCGHVYTCSRCDAPMTLYNPSGDVHHRTFRCNRCGKTEDAQTLCATCRSWRLESYGVGIEHVAQQVRARFPDALSCIVSRDTTPTPASAKRTLDAWEKTTSGILLGTEMMLPLLTNRTFDVVVITSLDTLTYLPDFRMGERVFHVVSHCAQLAQKHVIVQTRTPEYAALTFAKTGDGIGMYRYEENIRKEYEYPPFSVFIKITRRGKKEAVVADLTELQKLFPEHRATLYPAFVSRVHNTHIAHLLLSIPADQWPDPKISHILRALPPQYIVTVDPESLL